MTRLHFTTPPRTLSQWVAEHLEAKSFGITTEPVKVQFWKAFDRRRTAQLPPMRQLIRARFTAERDAVLEDMQHAGTPAGVFGRINQFLQEHQDAWTHTYLVLYTQVAATFGARVFASLKAGARPPEEKQTGEEIQQLLAGLAVEGVDAEVVAAFFDVLPVEVIAYLQETAGAKIVGITDTTLGLVRTELAAGIEAGEGIDALAARLRTMYDGFTPARAERIARTEIISSSNFGTRTAAKATGIPLMKQWLKSRDDRVRETHIVVDGQERALDAAYDVGGSRLLFPGDTSLGAAAAQTVNCRCIETYSRVA